MSRHHQGQRHQYLSSSGISVNANSNGAVVFSPVEASTLLATLAALLSLCVQYTYPLAAYLNFFLAGNMISLIFF